MRKFGKIALGLSASVAGITPAAAAPQKPVMAPPPTVVIVPKSDAGKMPNFAKMMEFVDKLFPPQPDPDPARLALARTSVAAMWPEGAYGRMMTGMMGGLIDRVMQMKASDLPAAAKEKAKAASTSDLSLHDQMAAKDPYFDKRMAAVRQVMAEESGKLSTIIDPRIRDGLARSMARRFDARQLIDINTFFATPSGHALAGQYMQIWVDPDMMRSLFGAFPEMIKLMPDMMAKVKAASERFPQPPKTAAKSGKP